MEERDSLGTSAWAQGHTDASSSVPPPHKAAAPAQPGVGEQQVAGAGAQLPAPCLNQAWAGPPRGSFLDSSVVISPTGEAPGVPDTQSATLETNIEMGKQR